MRPGGLKNSSQPASTHHQDTVGAQGWLPDQASTLLIAASATTHRRPTRPCRPTSSMVWSRPVCAGTGATVRVVASRVPAASSSAAMAPSVRCW
jgi:hypothetical protein